MSRPISVSTATLPEVACVFRVAPQTGVALTDLCQLVLGVDEVEHGGAFRLLVGGGSGVEWVSARSRWPRAGRDRSSRCGGRERQRTADVSA